MSSQSHSLGVFANQKDSLLKLVEVSLRCYRNALENDISMELIPLYAAYKVEPETDYSQIDYDGDKKNDLMELWDVERIKRVAEMLIAAPDELQKVLSDIQTIRDIDTKLLDGFD